jgi:hypothetical protein
MAHFLDLVIDHNDGGLLRGQLIRAWLWLRECLMERREKGNFKVESLNIFIHIGERRKIKWNPDFI